MKSERGNRIVGTGIRPGRLRAVGTALVLSLAVAGCSGAGPQAASTACEPSTGAVKLSFWSWVPGIDDAVDLWNAQHPKVQVELNTVPGGNQGNYQNLSNALKAGN